MLIPTMLKFITKPGLNEWVGYTGISTNYIDRFYFERIDKCTYHGIIKFPK